MFPWLFLSCWGDAFDGGGGLEDLLRGKLCWEGVRCFPVGGLYSNYSTQLSLSSQKGGEKKQQKKQTKKKNLDKFPTMGNDMLISTANGTNIYKYYHSPYCSISPKLPLVPLGAAGANINGLLPSNSPPKGSLEASGNRPVVKS